MPKSRINITSMNVRLAALALGAAVALGACAKRDKAAVDTASTSAMAGATAGAMTDTAMRAGTPSAPAMSDAEILAMIGMANANEIGASKMAETKATNPDVKAFAREMIHDHTSMQGEADALAKRLNVTPTPPAGAGDEMKSMAKAMSDSLKAAPKGPAFDAQYINGQVAAHQQTLTDLQRFQTMTQNADVKNLISTAIPTVETHLDRARQLQSRVSTRA